MTSSLTLMGVGGRVVVAPPPVGPLVAHTTIAGAPGGGTSAAVDTTGAKILVMCRASLNGAGSPTPTDSKSNTWTLAGAVGGTDFTQGEIWYAENPNVGSGHTFSETASYSCAQILAFNGVTTTSVYDTSAAFTGSGATGSAGSVTPANNGSTLVAMVANGTGSATAIGSGFTLGDGQAFSSGVNLGGTAAYLVQTTATSTDPVWTFDVNPTGFSAVIAVFKP